MENNGNVWFGTGDQGLIQFKGLVGINEKEVDKPIVQVFPNPFHFISTIIINDDSTSGSNLTIYDISGKEVKRIIISQNITEIRKDNLSEGMYFYQLHTSTGKAYTGKFIIY